MTADPKPQRATTREEMVEALRELEPVCLDGKQLELCIELAESLPDPTPPLDPGWTRKADSDWRSPRALSERVRRFAKLLSEGGPWTLHEHVEMLEKIYRALVEYEAEPRHNAEVCVDTMELCDRLKAENAELRSRLPDAPPAASECRVAHEATEEMRFAGGGELRELVSQDNLTFKDKAERVYLVIERARVAAQAAPAERKCIHCGAPLVREPAFTLCANCGRIQPAEPAAKEGVEFDASGMWLGIAKSQRGYLSVHTIAMNLGEALHARGLSLDEIVKVATGGGE